MSQAALAIPPITAIPTPGLMATLKQSTSEAHLATERAFDLKSALMSRENYRTLLARLFGLYVPLELKLAAVLSRIPAPIKMETRWKSAWLRQDLQYLGLRAEDLLELPRCEELPNFKSREEILGSLYVIEGSTLGGQHISRAILQRLQMTPATGARFFHGYGGDTQTRWQEFGQAAENFLPDPADIPKAVTAATAMFGVFERWLGSRQRG